MAEQRVPFDDRPALEELERLQRSIQEYRRKREQAEGEFEAFVGGFRPQEGQRSNSPARVAAPRRTIHPAGREAGGRAAGRAESLNWRLRKRRLRRPCPRWVRHRRRSALRSPESSAPPAVNVPPSFFADAHRAVTFDNGPGLEPARAAGTRSRLPVLIGGGAVLVVAGVLLMRTFSPVAAPETPSPAPARAATPTPAAETPPSGAPTPGAFVRARTCGAGCGNTAGVRCHLAGAHRRGDIGGWCDDAALLCGHGANAGSWITGSASGGQNPSSCLAARDDRWESGR